MGISAKVVLVAGVRYSDVVKVEKVRRSGTYYNEKTGGHYHKEVIDEVMKFGNIAIDPESDWEYELPEFHGLELFDPDYEKRKHEHAVFGVKIYETGDLLGSVVCTMIDRRKIDEAIAKAKLFLTRIGVLVDPSVWLVGQVS